MRPSLFAASFALLLTVLSSPAGSAPAQVAASPPCPGAVRIQNTLPGPVTVEITGASGAARERLRRVPAGQTIEVPIRARAEVSVMARGRLAPAITTAAHIQGVRIENTRPANAEVAIRGADSRVIETVRLRGRESRYVRVAGELDRIRVSVTRSSSQDGFPAEALADILMGGAAAPRTSPSPSSPASSGSNVHYHSGEACSDPSCPQASSSSSPPSSSGSSQGSDVAGVILDAARNANRTTATASSDLVCGGAMSTTIDGVKIALQATPAVSRPGRAFTERTGLLHVGRAMNLAGNGLNVILLDVGACGQALACRCGHAFCDCSRDGACGGRERTLIWLRDGRGPTLVHACCGENGKYCAPPAEGCEEGDWRWKEGGASKDCAFDAPRNPRPRIRLNPQIPRGEHAVAGATEALGEIASTLSTLSTLKTLVGVHGSATGGEGVGAEDAISLWAGIAGDASGVEIPTGPEELPSAYAVNALRLGQKMVEAGDRWAQNNARKMVDLVAEVEIVRITMTCAEIELCKDNQWVPGGYWPRGRHRMETKETLRMEVRDILIGEGASGRRNLNQAMGRVETWLRQIRFHEMLARKSRLENTEDPCSACDDPQAGPAPPTERDRAEAARRADCERLRRMLRDAELELNSNRESKSEYERRLAAAERGARELEARCNTDIEAARREMDSAREEWRRASRRVTDLLQIGERTTSPTFREAEVRERETRARRDQAVERFETRRRECDEGKREFESELGTCRSNLARLREAIAPLERRVTELQRNLAACERGR